jgi:hypothetical protein
MTAVRRAAVSALAVLLVSACGTAADGPGAPSSSAPAQPGLSPPRPVLGEWAAEINGNVAWAGATSVALVTGNGDVVRVDLSGDGRGQRLDRLITSASRVAADPGSGVVVAWNSLGGGVAAWGPDGAGIGTYQSTSRDLGAVAVRAGGDRIALVGKDVSVVDVARGTELSRGGRPDVTGTIGYNAVAYAQDRVVAWYGTDFTVDVWDVAGPTAVLNPQDCRCDNHRHVLAPDAGRAAFATQTGRLILWDPVENRAVGERAVVTTSDEGVLPLAVIRDRYVLYVLDRETGNGESVNGPLMVWDTGTDTTTELWACPGCEVREVFSRPGSDEVLLYTGVVTGGGAAYWTATLTT